MSVKAKPKKDAKHKESDEGDAPPVESTATSLAIPQPLEVTAKAPLPVQHAGPVEVITTKPVEVVASKPLDVSAVKPLPVIAAAALEVSARVALPVSLPLPVPISASSPIPIMATAPLPVFLTGPLPQGIPAAGAPAAAPGPGATPESGLPPLFRKGARLRCTSFDGKFQQFNLEVNTVLGNWVEFGGYGWCYIPGMYCRWE